MCTFTFGPFFTAKVMCDGIAPVQPQFEPLPYSRTEQWKRSAHNCARQKPFFPAVTIDHNLSHCSWPPSSVLFSILHRKAHM